MIKTLWCGAGALLFVAALAVTAGATPPPPANVPEADPASLASALGMLVAGAAMLRHRPKR